MSPTSLALIVLIVSGSMVIILDEWRLRLLALVLQYAAVAALMSFEVFPALGVIRLVTGAIVAMILFQAFRLYYGDSRHQSKVDRASPNLFLRGASILMAIVVSFGLAQNYPLPDFPRDIGISVYWLVLSSVSSLVLSHDVPRMGFALLSLELSAGLLAGVIVENANLARFLLASLSSIILALAVAFLVGLDRHTAASDEVES